MEKSEIPYKVKYKMSFIHALLNHGYSIYGNLNNKIHMITDTDGQTERIVGTIVNNEVYVNDSQFLDNFLTKYK